MNKFKYCKICGKTPLDCDFLKAEVICKDADLYNQGYEQALKDFGKLKTNDNTEKQQ